jgi:hypothetical protein
MRWIRRVYALFKWLIIVLVCIEVGCFLAVVISNYVIYGRPTEGAGVVYDSQTLFLSRYGMRQTVNNSVSEDPSLNRTIWMFGGSTMRGATEDDAATIPSLVVRDLNATQRPRHFSALNLGTNSFNSLLETEYLQKLLIERRPFPNIIVFYDGANDANYFAKQRHPHAHYGRSKVRALVESYDRRFFGLFKQLNAMLYSSSTYEIYCKLHFVAIPMEEDSALLKQFVDLAEARYDYVNKVTDCFGAKFFLFWQPIRWVEDCEVAKEIAKDDEGLLANSDRFAAVRTNLSVTLRAIRKRLLGKSYFHDLSQALCDRKAPVYAADGVHLNDAGRKMISQAIAEILSQQMGYEKGTSIHKDRFGLK